MIRLILNGDFYPFKLSVYLGCEFIYIIYTYLLFEINSPSTEIAQPSGHFKSPEVITLPSSATRPERKSVFDCERVIFSSRDKILSIRSIICIFVGRG